MNTTMRRPADMDPTEIFDPLNIELRARAQRLLQRLQDTGPDHFDMDHWIEVFIDEDDTRDGREYRERFELREAGAALDLIENVPAHACGWSACLFGHARLEMEKEDAGVGGYVDHDSVAAWLHLPDDLVSDVCIHPIGPNLTTTQYWPEPMRRAFDRRAFAHRQEGYLYSVRLAEWETVCELLAAVVDTGDWHRALKVFGPSDEDFYEAMRDAALDELASDG